MLDDKGIGSDRKLPYDDDDDDDESSPRGGRRPRSAEPKPLPKLTDDELEELGYSREDYEKMVEPYLWPEVKMLELWCLIAAGDNASAEKLKASIVEKYPAMRARIRQAGQGRTLLLLSEPLKRPAEGK